MTSLSSTRTWANCWWSSQGWTGRSAATRVFFTQSQNTRTSRPSFRSLGIKPAVAVAIQAAFPNIQFPTEGQIKFIPAIIAGYDVLLKDDTGTGKYVPDITTTWQYFTVHDDRSLGMVFALLNKPHLQSLDFSSGKPVQRPRITSLVIVPHRDLAHQFHYWIARMTAAPTAFSTPPLSNICQVLVREGSTPLSSRVSMLRENPPHILIGTPKALLEVLNTDRDALQLESLSAVMVDEVDYLIESVPRKDSRKMMDRARRKLDRHPSSTRQLLDVIYASRRRANEGIVNSLGESRSQGNMPELPQLIMASATLRNHLKLWLYNESGWLRKDKVKKVVGSSQQQRGDKTAGGEAGPVVQARWASQDGNGVTHSVLVVAGSGDTANIEGAAYEEEAGNAEEIVSTEDNGGAITSATVFNSQEASNGSGIDEKLTEKFANTRSPFNPATLEAIATVMAVEVRSVALLVLPASASVHRAVYELRRLGVDAHGLNLATEGRGRGHLLRGEAEGVENPTLLVSTLATSRGLDLPELTHVFILGIFEDRGVDGRVVDSYLHIAGRVGRQGKVISVVERDEGGAEERMKKMLDRLRLSV